LHRLDFFPLFGQAKSGRKKKTKKAKIKAPEQNLSKTPIPKTDSDETHTKN